MKKILILILIHFIIPITSVSSQGQYELVEVYPSDANAFTQGLELNDQEQLLLGTGLYGESTIGYLDLTTGQYNIVDQLSDNYFGEGITETKDAVWQLTWRNGIAFKRDKDTLEIIDEVNYEGEGWGLAYDGDTNTLWMSDGTSVIEQRDSETFEILDTIDVTLDGKLVEEINELEYVNGYIYANVWYTNIIIVINPKTGVVENYYDVTALLSDYLTAQQLKDIDTLNGIAHIADNRFYITGKLFPVVFEVELQ